jgi:hypothetical protein
MYKITIQDCPQDKQEKIELLVAREKGTKIPGATGVLTFQFLTGMQTDQFLLDLEKLGNDIDYILWV